MSTCGILFDFDGTLANTTPLILATFHKTLGHFAPGKTFLDQDIINTFGLPLRQGLAELTGQYDEAAIDKMTEYYRHFNFAWHDDMIRSFPGVKEGLEALHNTHVPMVIVTSKFKQSCLRGLNCLGLAGYIDGIIGCQECTAHKPDPEPMEKGLELLDVPADHVLCVGDSPYDLLSGRAAGCKTVKVNWTSFTPESFAKYVEPDYSIDTLKDLIHLLP